MSESDLTNNTFNLKPQEIATPPVPEYIYTVTTLETALKLAVNSSYEGLDGYRHIPLEYPNIEMNGMDTNYTINCYKTRKN